MALAQQEGFKVANNTPVVDPFADFHGVVFERRERLDDRSGGLVRTYGVRSAEETRWYRETQLKQIGPHVVAYPRSSRVARTLTVKVDAREAIQQIAGASALAKGLASERQIVYDEGCGPVERAV